MDMKSLHGDIRNEHYLVPRGDGTNIDVVRITDKLYLVDGAFGMARSDFDMHDPKDLEQYVYIKNEPLVGYRGAEKGYVISFAFLTKIQHWTMTDLPLSRFGEEIEKAAMEAYDEYKKRAGV